MKTYDAVIAGGGLIGATIALELAEAGLKVALFDAREPGREASWASAGMISPAPENAGMIPFVPMSLASVALYPEFIDRVERLTGMDVGYRKDGALDVILGGDAEEELSTVIALQHGVGLKARALSAEQARQMEPALTDEIQAAIFREDEASLDTRAFMEATLKAASGERRGDFSGEWSEGSLESGRKMPGSAPGARSGASEVDRDCGRVFFGTD